MTTKTYAYAVVPSPGMYGDGQVRVASQHSTLALAEQAAKRHNRECDAAMAPHGESSGYYYACKWGIKGDRFWSDMPPAQSG